MIFNLPGVDSLNLSPATVAGIFDQKVTTWDAPEIAADNPDAQLPSTTITPVNRSDESGTTENFVEYLVATAPEAWPHEASGDWPVAGGEAAQGTSGVVAAVNGGEGTVGYADASQAGDLGVAKVKVGDEFVELSPEAAASVVEVSKRVEGRGEYDYAIDLARDTTESGTYPIVLVSYALACTTYEDQTTADLVKGFLSVRRQPRGSGRRAGVRRVGSDLGHQPRGRDDGDRRDRSGLSPSRQPRVRGNATCAPPDPTCTTARDPEQEAIDDRHHERSAEGRPAAR